MKTKDIVNSDKLYDLLNKYSKKENTGDVLKAIIDNINSPEIIIPVLGMQGMGKSTIINSILSENILPNDADETTCVPVEVKYGEDEKAIVYFKNSSKIVKANTRKELNEYVDNMSNPGNEKGVSHIVLYRKVDILKNGATIVDLPGVGSLTKENQDTTMRYIKNLCTAIFVIPTTPTIRRSEEMFIKGVWMQFTSAIFVQNNFGETKREVRESVEFNTKVLKNIANSINTPFNDEIIVVNAYDAITGKLKEDSSLIESSNIEMLIKKMNDTITNWQQNVNNDLKAKSKLILSACKSEIDNILKESNMTEEELKKSCDLEEEKFKTNTKKLQGQVDKIEEFLEEKSEQVNEFAKSESKKCVENIRLEIFRLIDSGVVDGSMLTEAFKNYQQQYSGDVINQYYGLIQDIIYELSELMEELSEAIKLENNISISALNFNNGQAFKFEKGLSLGINVAGGLGAIAVTEFVATGATFGSAGGPMGIVAGVLAGAAVGIVASLLARGTKSAIISKRASDTKIQIKPVIDEIGKLISKGLISAFDQILEQVDDSLEAYIDERKKALKEIRANNIEKCKGEFSFEYSTDELKSDYTYIEEKEALLD